MRPVDATGSLCRKATGQVHDTVEFVEREVKVVVGRGDGVVKGGTEDAI